MSSLKTLCRPQPLFSFISCRQLFRSRASFRSPNCKPRSPSPSIYSTWLDPLGSSRIEFGFRGSQRRTVVKASNWTEQKSPYETLGNYFQIYFFWPSYSRTFFVIEKMDVWARYFSHTEFWQLKGLF